MTRTFTITQTPTSLNLYLYPNGDNVVQLTPVGETNNFDCVDDEYLLHNDDVDYVYIDSTTSGSDLYDVMGHTTESGTINYVNVFARAKSHLLFQASSGVYKILCGVNGTIDASDNFGPLTTSYQQLSYIWSLSPYTSAAWTWDEIDAMLIGVQCDSPLRSGAALQSFFRPNAAGVDNILYRYDNDILTGLGSTANYTYVDEIALDGEITYVSRAAGSGYGVDAYTIPNHTTETGTITSVSLFYYARGNQSSTAKAKPVLYINGSYYYGTEVSLPNYLTDTWVLYSSSWTLNPDDSAAFEWSDIDSMQIGIALDRGTGTYAKSDCSQLYLVVTYLENISPQIRTTQCYSVVNYTPGATVLTLQKPFTIDFNSERKINKSRYSDNTYRCRDRGSQGKIITLQSIEISDASTTLQTLRQMEVYGYPVTIAGLRDEIDGEYQIEDIQYPADAGYSSIRYDISLILEKT